MLLEIPDCWSSDGLMSHLAMNKSSVIKDVELEHRVSYMERISNVTTEKLALSLMRDGDICIEAINTTLLCPVSLSRMAIPTRTKNCKHLQCFELRSILPQIPNTQLSSITFICPICGVRALFAGLKICSLTDEMLKDHDAIGISFKRDGNWSCITHEVLDISVISIADTTLNESSMMEESSASNSHQDQSVIIISDGEGENA